MQEKRRYSLTLTPANVDRFQLLCKAHGLPLVTLSLAVDDFLRDISQVMESAQATGKPSYSDMFGMIGREIDKLTEGVFEDDKKRKKEAKGA